MTIKIQPSSLSSPPSCFDSWTFTCGVALAAPSHNRSMHLHAPLDRSWVSADKLSQVILPSRPLIFRRGDRLTLHINSPHDVLRHHTITHELPFSPWFSRKCSSEVVLLVPITPCRRLSIAHASNHCVGFLEIFLQV